MGDFKLLGTYDWNCKAIYKRNVKHMIGTKHMWDLSYKNSVELKSHLYRIVA